MIGASAIPWSEIYAMGSLEAAADHVVRSPRARREVLAGVRGFSKRTGRAVDISADHEPSVGPIGPPRKAIFLIGATADGGCIGHVVAYLPRGRVSNTTEDVHAKQIIGSSEVIDAVLKTIAPLAPEVPRPLIEHIMPVTGSGDSHALAVGLAATLALLGVDAGVPVAATGCWDHPRQRFKPVPEVTISAKLAAAVRWGIPKVLVVEGQEIHDPPEGVEIITVPSEPGALPLAVVEHVAESVASVDMAKALGLYDMQVARNTQVSPEAVFKATEKFADESCSDPILRQIAADIRSRTCLHAGRSAEAIEWLHIALALRGESWLPDGLVGDYLMYQQAAHHSVTMIDQGSLEDPPGGPYIHGEVDRLISELSSRWCTRHQSLCLIFLQNTRARRLEYLARLKLDPSILVQAKKDLFAQRDSWVQLLDDYAVGQLQMADTTLRRMHNQIIDCAVTQVSLEDPSAFGRTDWRPDTVAIASGLRPVVWAAKMHSLDSADQVGLYDLVALLKWWWLAGVPEDIDLNGVWDIVDSRWPEDSERLVPWPLPLVIEFLLRLDDGGLPKSDILERLERAVYSLHSSPEGSILRVLSIRSEALLASSGGPVVPRPESLVCQDLVDLNAEILSHSDTRIAKTPY